MSVAAEPRLWTREELIATAIHFLRNPLAVSARRDEADRAWTRDEVAAMLEREIEA